MPTGERVCEKSVVHVTQREADYLIKAYRDNCESPLPTVEVYTVPAAPIDGEPGFVIMVRSADPFACGFAAGYIQAIEDARYR